MEILSQPSRILVYQYPKKRSRIASKPKEGKAAPRYGSRETGVKSLSAYTRSAIRLQDWIVKIFNYCYNGWQKPDSIGLFRLSLSISKNI